MELLQKNSEAALLQEQQKAGVFSGIYCLSCITLSLDFSSPPPSGLPLNSSAITPLIPPAHLEGIERFPVWLMRVPLPNRASRRRGGENRPKRPAPGRPGNVWSVGNTPGLTSRGKPRRYTVSAPRLFLPFLRLSFVLIPPFRHGSVGGHRYMPTSEKLGKAKSTGRRYYQLVWLEKSDKLLNTSICLQV